MNRAYSLLLIPFAWNGWAYVSTWVTFSPNSKTKYSLQRLILMSLFFGGLGVLLAAIELKVKTRVIWWASIVGSVIEVAAILLFLKLVC